MRGPRLSSVGLSSPCAAAYRFGMGWLIAVGLVASSANAQQSLLQVSPGPLSQSHAKWDDPGPGCLKCHAITGPAEPALCLECHAHQKLDEAIRAKKGLHPTFPEKCFECHTDHKGRTTAIVDWRKLGGGKGFDHKSTGFALAGMHEKAKCSACHKARAQGSSISFVGLGTRCEGCHGNPHQFTKLELREQCLKCHPAGGVAPIAMHPENVPFDHKEDTGIALVGRHAKQHCVDCHKKVGKKANMSMAQVRSCPDCHKSKHGPVYLKFPCKECHDPSHAFKVTDFNHRRTDFPLEASHRKVACAGCHKSKSVLPKADCAACHKGGPHRDRFKGLQCIDCHARAGDESMAFAHAQVTKFTLEAKHAKISCRACHRGKKPFEFERFSTSECAACHAHEKAHNHEFDDKKCSECHQSGSKKLIFDHNRDAKFPLQGAHALLTSSKKCKSCHQKKSFRIGKLDCVNCHPDPHKSQLGSKCDRCHTPEVKFAKIQFDHARSTAFPLEGLHAPLSCDKCHAQKNYRMPDKRCVACHGDKEPHKGKLGPGCESCHTPNKGATRFSHESMTRFARTGQHLKADCGLCHRTPSVEGPPKLGWGKAEPQGELDKTFPLLGKKCAECHADPHEGRNGAACESCHVTDSFKNVQASVHDTGPFRLRGVHASLPCQGCHDGKRILAGNGEACQLCHRDDDAHRNALGPMCGDCHHQTDWLPARFSHAQTGFALRGVHRTALCRDCHGLGSYQGLPTECEGCHHRDAARVSEPRHTPELLPCDRCHQEAGFIPVRSFHDAFPLKGQHRQLGCTHCHPASYAGTPSTCVSCHLTRYQDPTLTPDHRAQGFGTGCEDCHTPTGWRPARQ